MRAEAHTGASLFMSLELKDRCFCVSNIVAKDSSTLCCYNKVMFAEGMPLTRFEILNFLLQSVFNSILAKGSLTDITYIYYSIITTSK
jgi:hypothetical protein